MSIQASVSPDDHRRRETMQLLSRATEAQLRTAWDSLSQQPAFSRVRGPETGLVMLRGRMGGGGSPFNLGEATVSRATVRLDSGEIGHGYTLGLSLQKAELAALFDALSQRMDFSDAVGRITDAVAAERAEADAEVERQTAATKVEFFTMVRGED